MTQGRDQALVAGVLVDRLDMAGSLERLIELVESGGPRHAVGVNAAKVVEAAQDPELARIIAAADVVSADGMSVVWASRMLGDPLPARVTGIDLIDPLLILATQKRWPVYLLGADEPVIEKAVARLRLSHPDLIMAGHQDGYIRGREADAVRAISSSGARLALIGMPSPMKEHLFARHLDAWGDCLVVGVGGSFDVISGEVPRAPRLLQRLGLEWAHRLSREPGRLWKRYLVGNVRFVAMVARQRLVRTRKR